MRRTGRITVMALAACLNAAAGSSRWGASYFPNVTLTTHEGKTVRFYDDLLKDKIVAIYLMYTTCHYSCPLETARLAQTQKLLGDRVGRDVFFYSISIDPARDTPEVLKSYAEKYRAGPGWLFLTGKPEDVELISKKLGLYSDPESSNPDGHTPVLLVGNVPAGQWMKNSALDNPRFLALTIGQFVDGWKNRAPIKSYAESPRLDLPGRGHYLFASKCAPCHTIGRGDGIGPDLLGVTRVRERQWLARFIAKPNQVLAGGDPTAAALFARYKQVRMPDLGLSDADVEALIRFLEARAGAPATPARRN